MADREDEIRARLTGPESLRLARYRLLEDVKDLAYLLERVAGLERAVEYRRPKEPNARALVDAINAAPEVLKNYVRDIETGSISLFASENASLCEQRDGLVVRVAELETQLATSRGVTAILDAEAVDLRSSLVQLREVAGGHAAELRAQLDTRARVAAFLRGQVDNFEWFDCSAVHALRYAAALVESGDPGLAAAGVTRG